jgi:hypothetical protein
MTPEDYRKLYQLLRQYQLDNAKIGGRVYNACDTLLRELFPLDYNQATQQQR